MMVTGFSSCLRSSLARISVAVVFPAPPFGEANEITGALAGFGVPVLRF
jgi:hypothetical protein